MPNTVAGKCSWFGGPNDPSDSGSTASGIPESVPGIAIYDRSTLRSIFACTFPNGRVVNLVQSDIGPAPWTGKKIDVLYSALPLAGYTEANFPTGAYMTAVNTGQKYTGPSSSSSGSHSGIPIIGGAIDAFNNATGYNQAVAAAGGVASGVSSAADAIRFIFSGSGIDRILKVAGGGTVILIAVAELIRSAGK